MHGHKILRRSVLLIAIFVLSAGAAQASASSATVVISYAKTCDELAGHCEGSAGNGGSIEMQVTSYRASGKAAQLTLTERITFADGSWFEAELNGHRSPAGFIVLNGKVTDGSSVPFVGAQVHQRSDYVRGGPTESEWLGELRLMPGNG
jgi:hypothetical protein